MAKAKKTDAAEAARRTRVEALRDDCRRHQDACVRLTSNENGRLHVTQYSAQLVFRSLGDSRSIEMALEGGDFEAQQRAIALLSRFGTTLAEARSVFTEPIELAMYALSMRTQGRTTWFKPSGTVEFPPLSDFSMMTGEQVIKRTAAAFLAAGFKEQTVREVPDVRASIAEFCEELLEVKPRKRRMNPGELWHKAVGALNLMRGSGNDPSDQKIATAIGVSKSKFSRDVGSKDAWAKERAGTLASKTREASRDPKSWRA